MIPIAQGTGSTQAFIDGENNKNINQQLDQKNLCLSRTCTLTRALSGDSSKVSQSNVCVNEADCKNTGENSKTVCVQSASGENKGVGTTVISRGSGLQFWRSWNGHCLYQRTNYYSIVLAVYDRRLIMRAGNAILH